MSACGTNSALSERMLNNVRTNVMSLINLFDFSCQLYCYMKCNVNYIVT